jgi:crotonobetainyl-CoA:carnitine CoA-transferase CaiB-like acyl-CoA transferase
MSGLPLQGVRVLDFSRVLAGPYCTMVLADLGADVIKVESPGGDDTRTWGPPFVAGESAYFLTINRGKRSIVLDLRDEADRATALELARDADVVVENFKAGGAERLGVSYEQIAAVKSDVVYCSITAFGSGREPPDRPGYDVIVQAESGLMSVNGDPDGEPMKTGVALVDLLAGLHASTAILAALHRGGGERIEVALLDVALASLANVAQSALVTGDEPRRYGNAHPSIAPFETFATADGWLMVGAATDGIFARLCGVLDRADLLADARFASNAGRVEHRDALRAELTRLFGTRPTADWAEALARAHVPAGPIRSVLDAFAAAADAGDAATIAVEHPAAGRIELLRSPVRFAQTEQATPLPPPLLGEHRGARWR